MCSSVHIKMLERIPFCRLFVSHAESSQGEISPSGSHESQRHGAAFSFSAGTSPFQHMDTVHGDLQRYDGLFSSTQKNKQTVNKMHRNKCCEHELV